MDNHVDALAKIINGSSNRYALLCKVIFELFSKIKLHVEDKHDVISDLSDILDDVQPSHRSGFIKNKK